MAINQEYSIGSIILISSSFKREPTVSFASPEYNNNVSFNVEISKEERTLNVFLTAFVKSGIKGKIEVEIEVKMLGTFTKDSPFEDEEIERFGRINAPAIIFPFIREKIASMSLSAAIPTILLPPMNFVKIAEEQSNKQD